MEKHQEDLVIGISISFVLVVICVSFTVKLQIIRKKRAKESRYPSSYVACPLNDIRSSQYFESHFVFRGNNPEAYENLQQQLLICDVIIYQFSNKRLHFSQILFFLFSFLLQKKLFTPFSTYDIIPKLCHNTRHHKYIISNTYL